MSREGAVEPCLLTTLLSGYLTTAGWLGPGRFAVPYLSGMDEKVGRQLRQDPHNRLSCTDRSDFLSSLAETLDAVGDGLGHTGR